MTDDEIFKQIEDARIQYMEGAITLRDYLQMVLIIIGNNLSE